ncbi:MAG: hypothetical protein U0792_08045 [Gemmataceae bacterium]
MPTMAVLFGITLIALGACAYLDPERFGSGKPVLSPEGVQVVGQDNLPLYEKPAQHAPDLIPAGVGSVILLAGIASIVAANARKHAMHAGAMASLLGAWAGLSRFSSGTTTYEAAVVVGYSLVVISMLFLALCINSFVQARKAREAAVTA